MIYPIIVPIAVECQLQGFTRSNATLWAGTAFLSAFWPYLLVDRCCIPSGLMTIFTWYSQYFWNPSLHSSFWSGWRNQLTLVVSIIHLVFFIFQCHDWASIFTSLHFPVLLLGFSLSNLKSLIPANVTVDLLLFWFPVLRLEFYWSLKIRPSQRLMQHSVCIILFPSTVV